MGRTALVTGATGGLGPSVVAALERDGWEVVQASRSLGHDLSDPEAARALVAGAGELGAVAHLVGGFAADQPVAGTSLADFQAHFDTHVVAAYNVAQAAIPVLGDEGAIVLLASRSALEPFAGGAGYASAKAAEIALGRAIDREGTRCNVIAPRTIDDPEAVADLVAFLCSPASRSLRGQVLVT